MRNMFQNKTWWTTAAGICATATLLSSAAGEEPTSSVPIARGHAVAPAGTFSEAPTLPKHWDLWANYCSQKRREHDPVRHYHPLVRMKHSLLPHHCHGCGHCGHGSCGSCSSDCYPSDARYSGDTSAHHPAPDPKAPKEKAQPPAPLPPVLQDQPARRLNGATPSPALSTPDADGVRPLPPIDEPIVVPPTTQPPAIPKNPLPRRSIDQPSVPRTSTPSSSNIGRYFETD